ncbi:hypothetical protein SAMN05216506_103176 [Saccharopolyspora kobensis]|uniref:Uncharacterized protein n=1 Tax=Saccharopolyspora kobensis TaxID=146035 RepID=A0ABY1DVF7_9PSEU|nr:hypothetical protein SAMN05216506_103176 [Saccharopolyspora kobensis]
MTTTNAPRMAEPKNRHDADCEVWTGDGACTCGAG